MVLYSHRHSPLVHTLSKMNRPPHYTLSSTGFRFLLNIFLLLSWINGWFICEDTYANMPTYLWTMLKCSPILYFYDREKINSSSPVFNQGKHLDLNPSSCCSTSSMCALCRKQGHLRYFFSIIFGAATEDLCLFAEITDAIPHNWMLLKRKHIPKWLRGYDCLQLVQVCLTHALLCWFCIVWNCVKVPSCHFQLLNSYTVLKQQWCIL